MKTFDPGDDDWIEAFYAGAEEVFALEWNSGAPGAGAGIEAVYLFDASFYATSLDLGMSGPYASFEEALVDVDLLRSGQIPVTDATTGLRSSVWDSDELIRRIELSLGSEDDFPLHLAINGVVWHFEELEHRQSVLRGGGGG